MSHLPYGAGLLEHHQETKGGIFEIRVMKDVPVGPQKAVQEVQDVPKEHHSISWMTTFGRHRAKRDETHSVPSGVDRMAVAEERLDNTRGLVSFTASEPHQRRPQHRRICGSAIQLGSADFYLTDDHVHVLGIESERLVGCLQIHVPFV